MILDHLSEANLQLADQRIVDMPGERLDVDVCLLEQDGGVGIAAFAGDRVAVDRGPSLVLVEVPFQGQDELWGERVDFGAGKVAWMLLRISTMRRFSSQTASSRKRRSWSDSNRTVSWVRSAAASQS
jgi:hypothetical protein